MASKLVIVESPAKAKTIAGYLGPDYAVEASVGHIRDIPTPSEMPADMKKGPFGRFGINIEEGFEPFYVVDPDKKKKVTELKRLLKDADTLYLATDEDREGEAIAWHLLETLKPKVPVKRMVFHEITKEAIQRAVEDTRELDLDLVNAQESRRILDRLYGYEVSPVLWRKVKAGLSAGRVQSVATRIVVERERERMAFKVASYWSVEGKFSTGAAPFAARLASLDGRKVATGSDFDDTGAVKKDARALDERAATQVAEATIAAAVTVSSVSEKPYTRRPYAPFTTSTLQQEAGRKLGLGSKAAMGVAQKLYENGYITYMRTDSTNLSSSALDAARGQARDMYGADFVPESPRVYGKKSKNAQEAHEAIRPAGDRFRTPAQVAGELRGDEFRLYELIWKRTVASQMADAKGSTATIRMRADLTGCEAGEVAEYTASGTVITFRGFLAAYEEGTDEPAQPAKDGEARLPKVEEGASLDVVDATASGHETSPPARYTEASLVKKMEELGIGRPSTYASTISTIQDRGYVRKKGTALVPTWLAFAVTRLMEVHFSRLVDYDFTASMEVDLDEIAAGDADRVAWLQRFYYGDEGSGPGLSGTATRAAVPACPGWSPTSATSTPGRSRRSRSATASSCGSVVTAPTSRRSCRRGSTRPPVRSPTRRRRRRRPSGRRSPTMWRPTSSRRRWRASSSPRPPTTVGSWARTPRPAATSSSRTVATAPTSPRCSRSRPTTSPSVARPRSSRARPRSSRAWTPRRSTSSRR